MYYETVNFVKPSINNATKVNHQTSTNKIILEKKRTPLQNGTKIKQTRTVNSVKCPCCTIVLNKDNYVLHLQAHSENQTYKILSKNLANVDTVLCPICLRAFAKNESFVFLKHIQEMHTNTFNSNFKTINNIIKCNKCNSILLGVHPAIIIQHLLNGCR